MESELLQELAQHSLRAAGHQVAVGTEPAALAAAAAEAQALLVEAGSARTMIRLLRERGFDGRALLFGMEGQEALEAQVAELGADGALAAQPLEDLEARFVEALRRRRRVLIVDDSELAAELLAAELKPKGFEVLYAPSADEATRLILKKESRPDLILLDIHMDNVDGAQFCTFLKGSQLFRGIKVVLCSGASRDEVEATAKACGADGFILKDEFLGSWLAKQID